MIGQLVGQLVINQVSVPLRLEDELVHLTRETENFSLRWSAALDIARSFTETEVDPKAGAAALAVLRLLQEMELDAPVPLHDGEGGIALKWKDFDRLYSLVISSDSIALLITRGGKVEFASAEYPLDREFPQTIWKQLQTLKAGPRNLSTFRLSKYLTATMCDDSLFYRALLMHSQSSCLSVLGPFHSRRWPTASVEVSPSSGQSTHPPTTLIDWDSTSRSN